MPDHFDIDSTAPVRVVPLITLRKLDREIRKQGTWTMALFLLQLFTLTLQVVTLRTLLS